ncbi:MAG: competence/damage-inducible protein A, partial [Bacillota bacterium]|nr:competence/damage-inducible protein A [Bacillota bacterium]
MASGSEGRPRAYFLITGEEILSGRVVDRNSAAVAAWARRAGLEPAWRLTVGDRLEEIVAGLQFLKERGADLLFVLGGLGPTADDLTRVAVARWLGRPLRLHEESLRWIEEVYRLRGLPLHEEAMGQAYLPKGALPIPNRVGTAPGFMVAAHPRVVVLPGPPRELLPMEKDVLDFLAREFPSLRPEGEASIFIADYAESAVATMAQDVLGSRQGLLWATYVHPGAAGHGRRAPRGSWQAR